MLTGARFSADAAPLDRQSTTTYGSGAGINVAIPDSPGANTPGAPATHDIVITDSGLVADLDLYLDVHHTYVGDLGITLTHIDTATTVTVINPQSLVCGGNDILATLDDESATPLAGQCHATGIAFQGTFQPDNPLSAFDGESITGTWRITVTDYSAGDAGVIYEWRLVATTGLLPAATDDAYATSQGTPLVIAAPGVLTNDSAPGGGMLTAAVGTTPTNGTLVLNADGSFTYTPAAGWHGADSFTYNAIDSVNNWTDTATVTITVGVPAAPVYATFPAPPAIPLCADATGGTSTIVRADVPGGAVPNGGVFCRVIMQNGAYVERQGYSGDIGNADVFKYALIHAVDVYGMAGATSVPAFAAPVKVCVQGSGTFLYLDATTSPRALLILPATFENGATCATIPHAGTVLLANGG
jgi:subtilisin-like proprotein convertase family protein